MNLTPEILAAALAETCEELEQLADLLVKMNLLKFDESAIQRLVLDGLTRIETCKIALDFEALSLNRTLAAKTDRGSSWSH